MKKLMISMALLSMFSAVVSCDMFKLDNYDGPNAQVTGKLIDVVTGEKAGIEAAYNAPYAAWGYYDYVVLTTGGLTVIEQDYVSPNWGGDPADYHAEGEQNWLVRFDGQFTNELIFAAKYKFSTKLLPFYEPEDDKNTFVIKEGRNRVNIGVLPFCRIKDPQIKYNAATKKVEASFYVELGDPSRANKISNVAFCANTQMFVGCSYQNLANNDAGAKAQNVTPGELVTLEIDTDVTRTPGNADLFKYATQDRYFRIAAEADGNGYNSKKFYNFSPIYKLSADFSTIEEVQWDENEW